MQKLNNFYSCTSSGHTLDLESQSNTTARNLGGKKKRRKSHFSRRCFTFIWQISLSERSIYTEKPPDAQDIFSVNNSRSDLTGMRGKDGEIARAERMSLALFRKQFMLGTTQHKFSHKFYYYSDRSFHHIKQ